MLNSIYRHNTNSNKDIYSSKKYSEILKLKSKLRLYRIWYGVMIAAIGLFVAISVICDGVDAKIGDFEFFFRFFIGIVIMVLGGNIIFLADNDN